jgi:hypothetical protein
MSRPRRKRLSGKMSRNRKRRDDQEQAVQEGIAATSASVGDLDLKSRDKVGASQAPTKWQVDEDEIGHLEPIMSDEIVHEHPSRGQRSGARRNRKDICSSALEILSSADESYDDAVEPREAINLHETTSMKQGEVGLANAHKRAQTTPESPTKAIENVPSFLWGY